MKKIRVCVKCWENGSGWRYTSEIDTIEIEEKDMQEVCRRYAKDYFKEQEVPEDEDYIIIFEENGNEVCRSNWVTELQNVD